MIRFVLLMLFSALLLYVVAESNYQCEVADYAREWGWYQEVCPDLEGFTPHYKVMGFED